jgi:hypothetical protein
LCSFLQLLLFHPSWGKIFSSAPCFQTPSVCVLHLVSETKFKIQIKLQSKL